LIVSQDLKKLRKIVVLEQVLTEVEAVAEDVRRHMLIRLEAEESLTMEMEEQERLIRALGVLGVDEELFAGGGGGGGEGERGQIKSSRTRTILHLLRHRHKQVLAIMHKMELNYFTQLHMARQRGRQLAMHEKGQGGGDGDGGDGDGTLASVGDLDFRELSMFSAPGEIGDEGDEDDDLGSDKDAEWDYEWELHLEGGGHAENGEGGMVASTGVSLLRLSAQYVDELSSFVVESIPGLLRLMQLLVSSGDDDGSGEGGSSSEQPTPSQQAERNRAQEEREDGLLRAFRPVISELVFVCARKLRVAFFGGEGDARFGEDCFADAKEMQEWLCMAGVEVESSEVEPPSEKAVDNPAEVLFQELRGGIAALTPQAVLAASCVATRSDRCIAGPLVRSERLLLVRVRGAVPVIRQGTPHQYLHRGSTIGGMNGVYAQSGCINWPMRHGCSKQKQAGIGSGGSGVDSDHRLTEGELVTEATTAVMAELGEVCGGRRAVRILPSSAGALTDEHVLLVDTPGFKVGLVLPVPLILLTYVVEYRAF
jgi:hypothetical protein